MTRPTEADDVGRERGVPEDGRRPADGMAGADAHADTGHGTGGTGAGRSGVDVPADSGGDGHPGVDGARVGEAEPIRVHGTITDAGGTRQTVELVVDDPRIIAMISPVRYLSMVQHSDPASFCDELRPASAPPPRRTFAKGYKVRTFGADDDFGGE